MKFLEQGIKPPVSQVTVGFGNFEHGKDIVLNAQSPKNGGLLWKIADTKPRPPVHRCLGDIMAIELDTAGIRLYQSGNHVKAGCLAGAVRSQKADGFPAPDAKIDSPHYPASLIGFFQP